MSSLRTSLLALSVAAALVSCAKKDEASPVTQGPTAKPVPVAATKPPPTTPVGPVPTQAPPAAFIYDPTGLRDPFEPFIKLEEKKPVPKAFVPRTPLQGYPADQLKLVGVVWGGDDTKAKALIEDPQGKGYAVGVGTLVGDRGGKVVRILPDRIVIEERFTDLFGEEKKNVANIMLHKSEGEVGR